MSPDDEPERAPGDEEPRGQGGGEAPGARELEENEARGATALRDAIRHEAGATEGWVAGKPSLVVLKRTVQEWLEDGATSMGAAVAYYAIFSLGPIVLLAIALAGYLFGQGTAWDTVLGAVRSSAGPEAASAVQTIAQGAQRGGGGLIATVVGVAALIFSATGVFAQLQRALNRAWEVEPRPGGIKAKIWDRALGFFSVLVIGALLIVSLVASSAVRVVADTVLTGIPGSALLLQAVNIVLSLLIVTVLFAALYKILPDADVRWRQLWAGAGVAAALFVVGKEALAYYLAQRAVASSYGAAGSIVVILLWVYYTALIFFLGAEFTQVYSAWRGEPITPDEDARWVHPERPVGSGEEGGGGSE